MENTTRRMTHRSRTVVANMAVPTGLLPWLALLGALLLTLLSVQFALATDEFGEFVPGQHVYDRAGLLTSAEVSDLKTRAAAVERAGAPTVVYLRAQKATTSETEDDARALMDAWDVQTSPGARDGLVIFLNLKPGDLRHGEVFVYAGQRHVQNGALPQYELDRIFSQEMRPRLASGDTAGGIASVLDAVEHDLSVGPPPPPPPSAAEVAARAIGGVPWNVFALVASLGLAAWSVRLWQARPASPGGVSPTTVPPDDLPPAVAGALVNGRVGDAQIEATLLTLAQRGAIAIEASGKKDVQVRLLNSRLVRESYEQPIWEALDQHADSNGVIDRKALGKVRGSRGEARTRLQNLLVARGWFDQTASRRRTPLLVVSIVGLVLTILVTVLLAALAEEGWPLIGGGLLSIACIGALVVAGSFPSTTREGEWAATPWRGYLQGLKDAKKRSEIPLNLDEALPYMVALGNVGVLEPRLKAASQAGYQPGWMVRSGSASQAGFYPYWMVFHSSVNPSSSGSSSGGGASAGGGGAGGSF